MITIAFHISLFIFHQFIIIFFILEMKLSQKFFISALIEPFILKFNNPTLIYKLVPPPKSIFSFKYSLVSNILKCTNSFILLFMYSFILNKLLSFIL
ncbi:hypothetical protein EGP95_07100 [bacterium]|nr:hypothetical protein [bacterium]